jgi:hypothetical protein
MQKKTKEPTTSLKVNTNLAATSRKEKPTPIQLNLLTKPLESDLSTLVQLKEDQFDFEAIKDKIEKSNTLRLGEIQLREMVSSSQEWSDSEKLDLQEFLDNKFSVVGVD